ncbi:alginate export family protein [Sphingomonas sp. NIBR02145]|uniref:alginate export family protein n=1 Tax=Sphingomonas sp. NIBR02145 TaxID=3014784 RepID=UPI0022B49C77|nr:alginate export family protein [Sphingomonas sp. NIBR02145]WHU02520.1 alginate export family protein [Sphingomonas sp. NIBR02145]
MRAALLLPLAIAATPAMAQEMKPIVDARLRYEGVDQAGLARDADALTLRVRAGFELKQGVFALLAESEGTLALSERYNSTVNGRTAWPVVADPENVEINRIQLQYRGIKNTVFTAGRQRIALDDQRFVGNVAWRQNEQTFDAVRVESKALGPVAIDMTYAWAAHTIYGVESPIAGIGGDNVFAGASVKLGPVSAKGFAYLVDQDATGRRQFSSQTYGGRAATTLPLGAAKLSLAASYARQSNWRDNPNRYAADYWLAEGQLQVKAFGVSGGYEVLGADKGLANTSFQTPLATLHKFQGWADKFLVTPADGIRDLYAGGSYALALGKVPVITLQAIYHRFDSDRNARRYGEEWDLQLGFKPLKRVAALIKYADYRAASFATDTRKLWLELDFTL